MGPPPKRPPDLAASAGRGSVRPVSNRSPSPFSATLALADAEATARLGRGLGRCLRMGDTLLLSGPIGAGKSHLARALIQSVVQASGAPVPDVPSPTYTLVQSYATGPGEILHADLYRLGDTSELAELGLDDALGRALTLIEWPDRLGTDPPDPVVHLGLQIDGDGRRARLSADAPDVVARLRPLLEESHTPDPPPPHDPPQMTHARPTDPQPDARAAAISAFLETAGWAGATRARLAGDASARRYKRLRHPTRGAAVLMDADPAIGEEVRPFVTLAHHLAERGLSPPAILAEDAGHGLLLLEDLGDDLFARLIDRTPAIEHTLYEAAVDLLATLHRQEPPPDLPAYGPDEMAPLAALAATWYAPVATAKPHDEGATLSLTEATRGLLLAHARDTTALALRDFHAENLLWLPDRAGHARVGLLDFQDAGRGHPGYDLVSLLADARRDVPLPLRAEMMERYTATTGQDPERFGAACAVLSAQRNLRILGVFARLSLRDGKTGYVDLIPRVWDNLVRDLSHPVCAPLRELVDGLLPAPRAPVLDRLRAQAGSCRTP
ncbi:MAG: tRNA (adenosine(37)-N6)-threonylcarbamoyltransferase complex ATPase subunit type 1 TsaE [Pseudomonadota bacterium]